MKINKTLQTDDMGTKRLLDKYGTKLVCVRCLVDKNKQIIDRQQ